MALSDDRVFRLAIEAAPIGIVVCDRAGEILFANRRMEAIFGYGPSELAGRSVDELMPLEHRPGEAAGREGFWNGAESRVMGACRDLVGRRKDGSELPVAVGLTPPQVDGQEWVVASVVDLSDRLALQRQMVETAREQAAFDRFVAEMAAGFVTVQPDQVDAAIVDGLAKVVDTLDADRSSWWRVTGDQTDAAITHSWTRPEYHVMQRGDSAAVLAPWQLAKLLAGEVTAYSVDDLPNAEDRDNWRRYGVKSGASVPFVVDGVVRGVLGCTAMRRALDWSPAVIDRLRLLAAVFGQALMRKESEERLQGTLAELQRLRDELAIENVYLRQEVKYRVPQRGPVAESPAMRQAVEQLESVAATDATVLLLGETGSGKEVVAEAIHRASERRGRLMITVNCAALPSTLIESELFGRERGAYTGALARQIGRFEMANDSTIFLDEIGDLPLEVQVKLLRVLQEKVVERLGGGQPVKVNVRIIAATNRDLEKAIEEGKFREDLYYRLNVFPITVPPLRDRVADIPALTWTFIDEYSQAFHKPIESISREDLAALKAYPWPGNVRELRNVIERAVIMAKGPRLVVNLPTAAAEGRPSTRLDTLESEQISRVLERVGWRVRGPGGAAELLGLKPTTLDSRMAKLGIRRPAAR